MESRVESRARRYRAQRRTPVKEPQENLLKTSLIQLTVAVVIICTALIVKNIHSPQTAYISNAAQYWLTKTTTLEEVKNGAWSAYQYLLSTPPAQFVKAKYQEAFAPAQEPAAPVENPSPAEQPQANPQPAAEPLPQEGEPGNV